MDCHEDVGGEPHADDPRMGQEDSLEAWALAIGPAEAGESASSFQDLADASHVEDIVTPQNSFKWKLCPGVGEIAAKPPGAGGLMLAFCQKIMFTRQAPEKSLSDHATTHILKKWQLQNWCFFRTTD